MWKRRIGRALALCALCLVCVRIFAVNRQWPAPKAVTVSSGEDFCVNGLSFCVKQSSIDCPQDVFDSFHVTDEQQNRFFMAMMLAQGWQAKILQVTVAVTNTTDQEITFEAGGFMAECGPWSNGVDHDLFILANPTKGTVQVAPSQTVDVRLFYDLYDRHFVEEDWQNLDQLPFALLLSLYPEKVMLCV